MAFIRAKKRKQKKQGEQTFYYVVQSYREEGKVRQETIAYLGTHDNVPDAIAKTLYRKVALEYWLPRDREKRDELLRESKFLRERGDEDLPRYGISRGGRRRHSEYRALIKRIEQAPAKLADCDEQLARLRSAAELLGITDDESLALPGTQKEAAIHEAFPGQLKASGLI